MNTIYFCLVLLVFSFSLDLGAWRLREETPPAPKTYSFNLTADWGVSPASSDQWKVNSLHFLFHSAVLIFPQLWLPLLPWRLMSFSPRDDADCQRLDKLTSAWWGTSWFFLLSLSFRRSLGQAHTKGKLIHGCMLSFLWRLLFLPSFDLVHTDRVLLRIFWGPKMSGIPGNQWKDVFLDRSWWTEF